MSLTVPTGYGLASIILTGSAGTQPYVTTIGVDLSAAAGDYTGVANGIMRAYGETIMPFTNDALTLERVSLFIGDDGPSGSVESVIASIPGENDAQMAPSAMSIIVRKVTQDLGRKGKGRMFLPGCIEEQFVNDAGVLDPTLTAYAQGQAALFLEVLQDGSGGTPPVLSTPPVLLHSSSLDEPTPILALGVSPVVGWIRGRIR